MFGFGKQKESEPKKTAIVTVTLSFECEGNADVQSVASYWWGRVPDEIYCGKRYKFAGMSTSLKQTE